MVDRQHALAQVGGDQLGANRTGSGPGRSRRARGRAGCAACCARSTKVIARRVAVADGEQRFRRAKYRGRGDRRPGASVPLDPPGDRAASATRLPRIAAQDVERWAGLARGACRMADWQPPAACGLNVRFRGADLVHRAVGGRQRVNAGMLAAGNHVGGGSVHAGCGFATAKTSRSTAATAPPS